MNRHQRHTWAHRIPMPKRVRFWLCNRYDAWLEADGDDIVYVRHREPLTQETKDIIKECFDIDMDEP